MSEATKNAIAVLTNHARNSKAVFLKLHDGKRLTKEEATQAVSFYLETVAQMDRLSADSE